MAKYRQEVLFDIAQFRGKLVPLVGERRPPDKTEKEEEGERLAATLRATGRTEDGEKAGGGDYSRQTPLVMPIEVPERLSPWQRVADMKRERS